MNSLIIFVLLVALLLTGMPISIALGMSVLAFLYAFSTIPVEIVSQRLFTGWISLRSWRFRFSSCRARSSPRAVWPRAS